MINKINYSSETKQFTAAVKDAYLIAIYYENNKAKNKGELSYIGAWIDKDELPLNSVKFYLRISSLKTSTILDMFWVECKSRPSDEQIQEWIKDHLDKL